MRDGGFFPVCWQTATRALLIMSVVCCSGPRLGAGDETTQVVDQRLVTELSACLPRGHGLKLRGHFEALAVRGRSVLGKLRALHDECPQDSAQRLSLAMACLVCGDVSNERLSELTIGVCSGDADRTEVTAVTLQAWSRPRVDPIRRLVSDEPELTALPDADAGVQQQIEAGGGRPGDRWALCADIRFPRLQPLLESLRVSGYRPIRVRPHSGVSDQDPRECVVWARDGRRWERVSGQQVHELPARRQSAARNGVVPVDVCLISGAGPYSG